MGWTANFGLSYGISPPHINLPYFAERKKKKKEKKETKQGVLVDPFKIRLKTHNFMRVTRFSLFKSFLQFKVLAT